ncbi:hypothetical protein DH2020_013768 [Rehmannia glutinosa]|uniref:Mannan endo-1,4-beta-mannosidase n=1 Tax=Rehmannia glutinosa TaxID=99300 RepID=A0ABR0X6J0_REHGL
MHCVSWRDLRFAFTVQYEFAEKWIETHVNDSKSILGKPLPVTEFGKSSGSSGYNVGARDRYLGNIFNSVYNCARTNGPCGGALFWQVMAQGMENWSDGYEVVLEQSPSTAAVVYQQSQIVDIKMSNAVRPCHSVKMRALRLIGIRQGDVNFKDGKPFVMQLNTCHCAKGLGEVCLFFKQEMELSLVGLQNAGKTSLVNVVAVGFNMRKVTKGNVTIKLWDLGGQRSFRSMWERYCRGVSAIV